MQSIGNPNNRAAIFNGQLPPIGNPAVAGRIALARAMQQNPVQVGPQGPQAENFPNGNSSAPPSPPPLTPYNDKAISALQAPQTGPVQHPLEALARALMPVAGNYQQGQNMVAERGQKEAQVRALSQAVAASRGGDPAGAMNTPNLTPEMAAVLAGQAIKPPEKVADYTIGNQRFSGTTNQALATGIPEPPKPSPGFMYGAPGTGETPIPGGPADPATIAAQAAAREKPAQDSAGPFAGTGMSAQAYNIVAAYEQRRAAGQPTTAQEDYVYALAQRELTAPRVVGTPETGFNQITQPPLPAYPQTQSAAQPPNPSATPAVGPQQPQTAGVTPITPPAAREPSESERKRAQGISNVMSAVQALVDHVNDNGLQVGGLGGEGGRQTTLLADAQMQAKNAYELGALAGPDMQLITSVLGDPTTIGTWARGFGSPANFLGKANTAMETFARQAQALPQTAFPNGAYPTIRGAPQIPQTVGETIEIAPGVTVTRIN